MANGNNSPAAIGLIAGNRRLPFQFAGWAKRNGRERVDLPVVGTGTVETLARYGIDGVVVEAGRTIVDDMADTIKLADEKNVFVYGVKI